MFAPYRLKRGKECCAAAAVVGAERDGRRSSTCAGRPAPVYSNDSVKVSLSLTLTPAAPVRIPALLLLLLP